MLHPFLFCEEASGKSFSKGIPMMLGSYLILSNTEY